jgi:hypothetical protein
MVELLEKLRLLQEAPCSQETEEVLTLFKFSIEFLADALGTYK